MRDTYGRTIDYLRLSVTDLCNYRCKYCMGAEGVEKRDHSEILTFEEYEQICRAAAACGVQKIRLTGGEPLVRHGIVELVRRLRAIDGIEELTLTTNGSLLEQYASALKNAGLDRINVSLDTLDEAKFAALTRVGTLRDVLAGLRAAENAGFTGTKLNTVLIGGFNDDEIPAFVALTKNAPIEVRFIELMPMGACAAWPQERFLPAEQVLAAVPTLQKIGVRGVAELYRAPDHRGTVGLIRPMSHRFCASCSRIRVTADGKLKPCLHSAEEIPLRGLRGRELENAIRSAIAQKPAAHSLSPHHPSGARRAMNEIGG